MAFVVSSGALRGIERAAPPPVYSMHIGKNQYRSYAALWRAQPELRTVVDFLARNIAQLGLHVFRRASDVDRVRLIDHPLTTLLGRPNTGTTPYRMIDALVHDMCIFDNGYWLKVRDADEITPLGLRRIRPNRIVPIGENWLEPEKYEIFGNRGRMTVDAGDVVHYRGYNPDDDCTGTPPIESLRQILTEEWAANVYREQLWRNGARLSGVISRPVDAPDWGPKGRDRFRSEWQAQYSGDSSRAGEVAMLEDGMTFTQTAVTPRDSQAIEFRKLTREEVARSYHVPLPMVGILDHATFSNIRELHKNLYQDCLGPWLENFQQEIELQLLPDMPDRTGVYVEFNFAAKLNGSFEEQAAQLQGAVGGPYMARNEARARLNLPMIEGGDDLILPLNVTVGDVAPAELEPPGPELEPPGPEREPLTPEMYEQTAAALARFFTRQGKAVVSRVGAEKARGVTAVTIADVFDTERWNGELAADLLLLSNKPAFTAVPDLFGLEQAQAVNAATAGDLVSVLDTAEPGTEVDAVKDLFTSRAADPDTTPLTGSTPPSHPTRTLEQSCQ